MSHAAIVLELIYLREPSSASLCHRARCERITKQHRKNKKGHKEQIQDYGFVVPIISRMRSTQARTEQGNEKRSEKTVDFLLNCIKQMK